MATPTSLHRRPTWGATFALLAGLLVFALIMSLVGSALSGRLSGLSLVVAGLVLALVPALLWLGIFYLQDRREPEPKTYVMSVFALGALLAGAVGEPLLRNAFDLGAWGGRNLLANILIRGGLEAGLVYIAVRASVYRSREFDEYIDGMVYGVAAGLGQATMLNFHYVLNNGGVELGVGAVKIVIAALALATVGGIVGYGLAQARFRPLRSWLLPAAVLVAMLVDGLYNWVQSQLAARAGVSSYNPLFGLAAGIVFAALALAALYVLLQQSARDDLEAA